MMNTLVGSLYNEASYEPILAVALAAVLSTKVDLAATMDLTMGPLPAPQVHFNPISEEFWVSWVEGGTHIDVKLANREELRVLIRNALEAAAESEREAHAEPRSG